MFAPAVAAAQTPTLRLTLEEAQARALAASHRLAEARAREAAALGAVAAQQAADRPTVSLGAGYNRTNHVDEFIVPGPTGAARVLYPDIPNNYFTRIDLQWPIYTGGRLEALEAAARAEAGAAATDIEAAQAELRLEVARVYWALVSARATVDVLEQALVRAQAHVADVRERFNAGLVPPNEIASAQAQESRQRMLLIQARNQRDLSSAALARLTGEALDQPIEPVAALDQPAATAGLNELVAQARSARGERRGLTLRIDAGELREQAAARSLRPLVAVTGGIDYARPNPRIFPRMDRWEESWQAGINVSWSLWDGGRARAEAVQAAAQTEAARARLAEFDSLLALEVQQRLLDIESGRAAVAAAEDAITAAREARRVTGERYQAGVATQTEVLDADVALLQAELDRTRALANLRLADAQLARALGR